MANELVARRGLRVSGETFISTITADTLANSYASVLVHGDNDAVASVSLENVLTGATAANNDITLTNVTGGTDVIEISALTDASYSDEWGITLTGDNLSNVDVDLPFITGGSYSEGTITLGINGGLEDDITIEGLTSTDSFATGATLNAGVLSISGSNDFTPFNVSGDSFSFDISGDTGSTTVNLGSSFDLLGGLGIQTEVDGNDITISAIEEYFTAATIANNQIELDGINGLNADLQVIAFTAATVNEWGIDFSGSNGNNQAIELPFITGGSYDNAGTLTLVTNEGAETIAGITGWDYLTGHTTGNSNGLVTFTDNSGTETSFSWKAVSAIEAYGVDSGDWGITVDSYTAGAVTNDNLIDLPFITGGSYSDGTITLSVNDGLESNIEISGLTSTDSFATGGTLADGVLTLSGSNDFSEVTIAGSFELNFSADTGGTTLNLEEALTINGGEGVSTEITGDALSISLDESYVSGASYNDATGILTLGTSGGDVDVSEKFDYVTGGTVTNGQIAFDFNVGDLSNSINLSFTNGLTYVDDSWTLNFEDVDGSTATETDIVLPFITGGSYNDGTIVLEAVGSNDEGFTGITITGLEATDTFATGGTYTASTGTITINGNEDFNSFDIVLGEDFVTGVTGADNTITITNNGGDENSIDITAFTAATVNEWGIDFSGSNGNNQAIELPFITAVDLANGELSFTVNGSATIDAVTGFSFDVSGDTGSSFTVDLESGFQISGGTGVTVSGDGSSAVVISVDDQVDTFATGSSVAFSAATIEGNDGFTAFTIDSEQTLRFSANATAGNSSDILQIDANDYETLHVEYVIHDTATPRIRRAGSYFATWDASTTNVIDAEQSTKNLGSWTGSEPTITVSNDGSGTVTLTLNAASNNATTIKANVRAVKTL